MGGIGQAICSELYDQGFRVVAAYQPSARMQLYAWQENKRKNGYQFDIVYVDVTDFESCKP